MQTYRTRDHICQLQAVLIPGVCANNVFERPNSVLLFATIGKLHTQASTKCWRCAVDNQYFIGNVQFAGAKGQLDY
jgi:hypothetical protein